MTPEQYLKHLNAQAEQRSREQAQRMLGERGMSRSDVTPMPEARTAESDASRGTATSTVAQPTDLSRPSATRWVWRLLWAGVAAGVTLVNPALGQLVAGNLLVFLVLLVFGEETIEEIAHLEQFAQAGIAPDTVVRWITLALVGWAVLRILMRGIRSSDRADAPGA